MNTPAHLIFGAAAFARPNAPVTSAAAVFGALVPDLSLYILVTWSLYVQGISAQTVFDQLYFSPDWQAIFAVDNSIPLWGCVLILALLLHRPALTAFAGSGLLHLAFDLPLHNEDARRHFWPISDWVFRSPISYWDPQRYGHVVGPIEMAVCVVLSVLLWRRFQGRVARGLILAGLTAELLPELMFRFMLHG